MDSEKNTICALIHCAYEKNLKMTNDGDAPVRHVLHQRRLWRDLQQMYGSVEDAEAWARSSVLSRSFLSSHDICSSTNVILSASASASVVARGDLPSDGPAVRHDRAVRSDADSDDDDDEPTGYTVGEASIALHKRDSTNKSKRRRSATTPTRRSRLSISITSLAAFQTPQQHDAADICDELSSETSESSLSSISVYHDDIEDEQLGDELDIDLDESEGAFDACSSASADDQEMSLAAARAQQKRTLSRTTSSNAKLADQARAQKARSVFVAASSARTIAIRGSHLKHTCVDSGKESTISVARVNTSSGRRRASPPRSHIDGTKCNHGRRPAPSPPRVSASAHDQVRPQLSQPLSPTDVSCVRRDSGFLDEDDGCATSNPEGASLTRRTSNRKHTDAWKPMPPPVNAVSRGAYNHLSRNRSVAKKATSESLHRPHLAMRTTISCQYI